MRFWTFYSFCAYWCQPAKLCSVVERTSRTAKTCTNRNSYAQIEIKCKRSSIVFSILKTWKVILNTHTHTFLPMWNDEQIFKDRVLSIQLRLGYFAHLPQAGLWVTVYYSQVTNSRVRYKQNSQEVGTARVPSLPVWISSPSLASLPPNTESYKAEMSLRTSPWSGNGQIFILNNAHVRNE